MPTGLCLLIPTQKPATQETKVCASFTQLANNDQNLFLVYGRLEECLHFVLLYFPSLVNSQTIYQPNSKYFPDSYDVQGTE